MDNPTWLVILVPVGLGIAALVLLIITLLRLRNRKVVPVHQSMLKVSYKQLSNDGEQMGLNSDRNGNVES